MKLQHLKVCQINCKGSNDSYLQWLLDCAFLKNLSVDVILDIPFLLQYYKLVCGWNRP